MPGEIVLARIDNRLIHGQVLEAWVPFVHADCIIVANDEVATRPLQMKLMAAAVPSDIRVFIGRLDAVAEFVSNELGESHALLLFADSSDALRALRSGIPFHHLNLGNLHGGDGKRRISCTIAVDDRDLGNFHQIEADGVQITARCIPSDDPCDWKQLLLGSAH